MCVHEALSVVRVSVESCLCSESCEHCSTSSGGEKRPPAVHHSMHCSINAPLSQVRRSDEVRGQAAEG